MTTMTASLRRNGSTAPAVDIETTTEGGGVDEVQRVGYSGMMVTGGTFTLTFDGQTTSAIAYDATAWVYDKVCTQKLPASAGLLAQQQKETKVTKERGTEFQWNP